ncbi:MFS transporter [Streptomyces sp. NPDC005827]|uniref:MFS transporter n=1 Tax=Streptomyces sp. NPDC005827 TaxID=3157070 RepID=UPI0034037B67
MLEPQRVVEPPAVVPAPRSGSWQPVAAAMFACGWGGNQFTPLLLMYRRLGGYSTLSVDAFLGAYVVGLIPGLLLAGPVSDRRGRRPVLVFGTVASVLASVVLSFGADGAWAIYTGRLITGFAVGIAMSVGSSWVKELSIGADSGLAARRAALCQTAGFALGAGVAGALAQWGPWPMVIPYIVHILLTVAIPVLLLRVPETRPASPATTAGSGQGLVRGLVDDLRVPAPARRRFRLVVLPMAPWVFGAAGLAYAVMPQLVESHLGRWGLAYATALTVLMLGTGAAVQPIAKRLQQAAGPDDARACVVAMCVMLLGSVMCAANAVVRSPWLAVAAAITLGAAYGIAVVSGLLEIQRMASQDDLAGLTGIYYTLAYAGFLLPAVLATLSHWLSYPVMLSGVALVALGCLALVIRGAGFGVTARAAAPTTERVQPDPGG